MPFGLQSEWQGMYRVEKGYHFRFEVLSEKGWLEDSFLFVVHYQLDILSHNKHPINIS